MQIQTEPAESQFLPLGAHQCICFEEVTKSMFQQIIEAARELGARTNTGLILVKLPGGGQVLQSEAELAKLLN